MLDQYLRSLGHRIQLLCRRSAWSQGHLAERSGLDRAYIRPVEHGKQNLSLSAVMKLASAFELPIEVLLTGMGTEAEQ